MSMIQSHTVEKDGQLGSSGGMWRVFLSLGMDDFLKIRMFEIFDFWSFNYILCLFQFESSLLFLKSNDYLSTVFTIYIIR